LLRIVAKSHPILCRGKLNAIHTTWRKCIPERANDADCRLVKLAPDFLDAHLSGWNWDAGKNIRISST